MPQVSSSAAASASTAAWPEDSLEAVPACPVCGGAEKELLHRGLRDRLFGCAPGEWNLSRCGTCGAGYLDPRPNAATIALAYSHYYTHGPAGSANPPASSPWRGHRIAQRNAYLNAQYGYQLTPASARIPRWLSQKRRQRFDSYTVYQRYPGKGSRLLDIGCGNGSILLRMRMLGWEVSGVEPDPKSAAEAVAAGLDVRVGLLESQTLPEAHYDAITLNHVIEHLHNPLGILRLCRRVLKPGGTLFIATPNFAARGHHLFGRDWFPLDPPRHLVLFTPGSLRRALELSGFHPEPSIRLRLGANDIFKRSLHVRNGSDPMRKKPALSPWAGLRATWLAWLADQATRSKPELAEELVMLARRPEANGESKPGAPSA